MAHEKSNKPEHSIEAYQFAEIHHLGTPLKTYRAHFTDGLGCTLTTLGLVVALVPLGGFFYDDYTLPPMLLQVTGYCVLAFLLIAFILLLPGFLTRKVRVYLCSNGLIYIRTKPSKRKVVFWEQVTQVESPSLKVSHRPSPVRIALDLLFGGGEADGLNRGNASRFDYCIVHLADGSKISFSQAITNLSGLAKDIRGHLRRPGA
ncbi:MAG TPA: DUF6585 family protein [Ktedonobacteraceae bacterium]